MRNDGGSGSKDGGSMAAAVRTPLAISTFSSSEVRCWRIAPNVSPLESRA